MPKQVTYTQVIERPIDRVFHFMVDEHVRNHPRWDSDIELWLESDEPIQLGTIIHRRNHRGGQTVEGTMEVVEFERDRSFATEITDGPAKILGKVEFERAGDHETRVTVVIDFAEMDETMDTSFIESRLEETGEIRKQLIESET